MNGPEGLQRRLEQYLAASVPASLDRLAVRVGLDPATRSAPAGPGRPAPLPNPQVLPPAEVAKLTVEQFPALIVTVWDATEFERVDLDPGDLVDLDLPDPPGAVGSRWRVHYVCRVFVFARGKDYADTNWARFRYALALRETLLGRPGLGDPDGTVAVDETTWRESYSELEQTARRTIGAAYAEFGADVVEDLTAPAQGVGGVLEVYTEPLPPMVTTVAGRDA